VLITQVTPAAFSSISAKFLQELDGGQVSSISVAQLSALPTSTLANLTTSFFDKLDRTQYAAIKDKNNVLSKSARGLLIAKYGTV
jgi:hypothetical protein